MTLTLLDRFIDKVEIAPTGCWLWVGGKNPAGYGRFGVNRRLVYAHRWSYETFVGPIPPGLILLHSCNTPSCVNPRHLRPGTQKENMADVQRTLATACSRHGTPVTRTATGAPYCRACNTEKKRRQRRRKVEIYPMETMTLSCLWHVCDPETHVECSVSPTMEVTSKRPPSDTPLVIEFHPPRYAVEGDGPVYQVLTETLLNWPHVISSRVGTEKR